jgi:hypothetical protein
LQLLLALASVFILGSESRGTHGHILRSQIQDFPFCRLLRLAGLQWSYSTRKVKVKVKVILRPTVNRPVCLGIKHTSGAYDQIFITVRQLRVCSCGVLSLTRGRVCRLQLLLALARVVSLGSECGTRDHMLLSQIRDFPFRRLLQLAGLRWRYSTPSPPGEVKVNVMLRPTVQSANRSSLYRLNTDNTENNVFTATLSGNKRPIARAFAWRGTHTKRSFPYIVTFFRVVFTGRCMETAVFYCSLYSLRENVYRHSCIVA